MSKRVMKEEKETIVQRFKDGEAVTKLVKTTGFSRSSIYSWIKKSKLNLPEHVFLEDKKIGVFVEKSTESIVNDE